jgi:hypothetical protein
VKNFPHQFNDLTTLTAALNVASVIIGKGDDFNDDGIFGEALAYARVYNFRGKVPSIRQKISEEKTKKQANQGFRTAARDIRRFFVISGLIQEKNGSLRFTKLGKDILGTQGNEFLRNALWREAMLQMPLETNGAISHPYRILLKLVADNPAIETPKLMLALEATDDSDAEYARLMGLAKKTLGEIINTLGVSEPNAKNAVKILPAIAEQVGDIQRRQGRVIPRRLIISTEDSVAERIEAEEQITEPKQPKAVRPDDMAVVPNFKAGVIELVDLAGAIEIRKRRTIAHHGAVVSFAKLLAAHGYTTYENPYDCLGYKNRKGGILAEVKTLDGSRPDERRQAEKALGQLKGYKYFNVVDNLQRPRLIEVAAFSDKPDKSTIDFMKENGVQPAWLQESQWLTTDRSGNGTNLLPDALFPAS